MFLGIAACIAVWITTAKKLARGESVLPYQQRRPVPWRGRDVALIFLAYLLPALVALGLSWVFHVHGVAEPARSGKEEITHPVLILAQGNPGALTLLFCVFTVVVVAPIVEEVLFRLVLQGWLEAVETASRRRRLFWSPEHGFWPVAMTSVLFASLHFRTAQPPLSPKEIVALLAQMALWNLATLAFALAWLRLRRGATWTDFGFVPASLLGDIRLGILAFLAVAAPIYLLQAVLQWLLQGIAADPITLTWFAIVLGVLYFRTHRLVPSIVLHMALNGTSLAIAWSLSG
jgi:membrane protease YdiL (CAAX protease family)